MPISVSVTGAGAYTSPPGAPQNGQPYVPPPSPTYIAKITYDGVDITPIVVYADAEFISRTNGNPGSCRFRVRDGDHSHTFTTGRPLRLFINGLAEWTGFVSKIGYETAFKNGPATQMRFLVIEGVDINILFRKRHVWNQGKPKEVGGKTYKYAGTPTKDTTALADLTGSFLDLGGDDIDTSSKVTNVGDINVDQDVNPFASGWTWEQAMNSINTLPAAVYYINPDKKLVWADVDSATAPFTLSDSPNYSTTFGYREMELLYDGSSLTNDYYAWGAGAGSAKMVFKKLASPSSITKHGLWQGGIFKTDVYKQATIDRVASAYLNGSPSSKRGYKDDKVSITCTTFRQGLQAGMAVNFLCGAYSFSDVIPIRQMRITFPAPTTPRYDLTMSHEMDTPWSFYDTFYPRYTMPRWAPVGSVSLGSACLTDHFDRTTSGSLGTGDLGQWVTGATYGPVTVSTGASIGSVSWTASAGTKYAYSTIGGSGSWSGDFDMAARFYYDPSVANTYTFYMDAPYPTGISGRAGRIGVTPVSVLFNGSKKTLLYVEGTSSSMYRESLATFSGSTGWYLLRMTRSSATVQAKVWLESDTEPAWQVTVTADSSMADLQYTSSFNVYMGGLDTYSGSGSASIDYISFCSNSTVPTTTDVEPGEIRGDYVGTGTATVAMGTTYFKGTTRVWKNGLAQRLNVDYTEEPQKGTIVFASATSTSDKIVACYVAASGTNGGPRRRMF